MRALALIRGPLPPLVARVLSSSRRPRSTWAPMLTHLAAHGRHLSTNMSQHCLKMTSKIRSWRQHGPRQCSRRLNKPLQPPQNSKTPSKNISFSYTFFTSHLCPNMASKSTPNRPNKPQVEHQVAILVPTCSNLGRSWSNLALTSLILGSSWRRFSEKL